MVLENYTPIDRKRKRIERDLDFIDQDDSELSTI